MRSVSRRATRPCRSRSGCRRRQEVRGCGRRRPHRPRGPGRRVLQPPRSVRLRQDDDAADDRRLRGADVGPDRAPGPGRDLAAAVQAQRQHGLPELRALPAPDDLRERRLRPAPQGRQGQRGQGPGPGDARAGRAAGLRARASRPRSPAARRSASRSPGRSINRPAVLLLDEPLGALDLKLRKQMQVELKRIQQEVGITFIYVTHDQEEAMTMSDRIAVMNRGRYEQLGDPESLYERPKTRFVAGFLGVSNLLAGIGRRARTATVRAVRLADDTNVLVPPRGLERRGRASTSACDPRRSGCASRSSRRSSRPQRPARVDPRRLVPRGVSTQYQVEAAGRRPPGGLRAERRADVHGSLVQAGGRGPAVVVAGPHVRRRRARPGRRHRRSWPDPGGRTGRRHWRNCFPMNQDERTSTRADRHGGTVPQGHGPRRVRRLPRRLRHERPGATAPSGARRRAPRRIRPRRRASRGAGRIRDPVGRAELRQLAAVHRHRRRTTRPKHKTLEDFTAKYGTVVNYSEVINDNDEFFGTIQPALAGRPGHRLGSRSSTPTGWRRG